MTTLYFSAPLTGLAEPVAQKQFYERAAVVCRRQGFEVYLPHQASDPILHANLSPRAVYELDRSNIARSGGVLAYVGIPAIGCGQEIEIAREMGLPVVLMYERGRPVTRMVLGCPAVIAKVIGADRAEMLEQLERTLAHLRTSWKAQAVG